MSISECAKNFLEDQIGIQSGGKDRLFQLCMHAGTSDVLICFYEASVL